MTQPPGPAPQADPPADVAGSSVGELMSNVMKDVSTLVRQEVELAKAETKAEATKAAKGAGMVGGAGFAGYMVVLFLSVALWQGLENVLDGGWAALIVRGPLGWSSARSCTPPGAASSAGSTRNPNAPSKPCNGFRTH